MIRIAVTPPELLPCEADMIEMILDHGWDYVHLRHPSASRSDIRNLIESVGQKYHRRLRLHGHFDLLNHFNLGGIHLNSRCPVAPANFHGSITSTCHSVDEVLRSQQCDYVTLSPVFDSVSKTGYNADEFDFDILKTESHPTVIALGGITPERIGLLDCSIFGGYAVLGYLFGNLDHDWHSKLDRRLNEFK